MRLIYDNGGSMKNKKSGMIEIVALAIIIILAVALAGHSLSFASNTSPSPSTVPPALAPYGYNYNLIPHSTTPSIMNLFAISGVNSTVSANIIYLGNTISTTLQLNIPSYLRTTSWVAGTTKMVDTSCGSYVWSNSTNTYVYESGIYNGTGSSYSPTLSYTPTSTGVYIVGAACITTNTTFTNGAWTSWSTPNVTLSTYQVYKVPQLYTLTLTNNGCTSVIGSGTFFAGNSTGIEATVPNGYSFSWIGSGNGAYSGSNNPTTITLNGNIIETAVCSTPPPPTPPSTNIFSQIANLINSFVQNLLHTLGL